ncbi:DNA polymerase III subunit epsilon [Roseicella aquatilis]|uniref:DNA polymerase III subunit epsilon n=1 Tax=Roseicella aquatilis TaxID=2527868 RepID=A0A4R4D6B5_9PROT|nr:DNA polymerase III subunit epsilon [Roseicella aquatilis]TCZ55237.1 DNA polymerase III subunit epsilon [Roseicella aquatilis]
MRQLVLDTETTGLDPATGDRVIEIAAIEIVNLIPTGQAYHTLLDPERDVPEESTRVHGFTAEHLRGKPKFAEVVEEFLAFLGEDQIVAHNAPFDFGFLDAELVRAGRERLDRARMVDSLAVAKKRFPGMPNSLDALCRRLGVDNSMRTSHNALLDVKLLAQVYLELMGGKQPGLTLAQQVAAPVVNLGGLTRERRPRPIVPSAAELEAHAAFLGKVKDPLWLKPPFAEAPAEGG